MSCARTSQMLDAWIDDELDPATSQEIARHVESCTECGKRRAERDALRATLRTAISVAGAPAALKLAVLRKLQAESVDSSPRPERVLPWWQAVVFAMAASTCAAMLTFFLLTPPLVPRPDGQISAQLVALHANSLAGSQLIDVASSERHVVKPWFHGKVDFAPPVRDFSADGFVLLGARLEHVGVQPAAALVYKIRKHPVNLFVWRGEQGRVTPVTFETVHGFTVGTWSSAGLNFAVVSDVEARELAVFAQSP